MLEQKRTRTIECLYLKPKFQLEIQKKLLTVGLILFRPEHLSVQLNEHLQLQVTGWNYKQTESLGEIL